MLLLHAGNIFAVEAKCAQCASFHCLYWGATATGAEIPRLQGGLLQLSVGFVLTVCKSRYISRHRKQLQILCTTSNTVCSKPLSRKSAFFKDSKRQKSANVTRGKILMSRRKLFSFGSCRGPLSKHTLYAVAVSLVTAGLHSPRSWLVTASNRDEIPPAHDSQGARRTSSPALVSA